MYGIREASECDWVMANVMLRFQVIVAYKIIEIIFNFEIKKEFIDSSVLLSWSYPFVLHFEAVVCFQVKMAPAPHWIFIFQSLLQVVSVLLFSSPVWRIFLNWFITTVICAVNRQGCGNQILGRWQHFGARFNCELSIQCTNWQIGRPWKILFGSDLLVRQLIIHGFRTWPMLSTIC